MPLNPVSSSLDSGHESLLCPFVCESEARRLYWAGRLRVSIDLLLMKNHQSQLDLVMLPPSYPTPHPLLHHRTRSLFNILQDDRPPAQQFVANEEGQLFFAMEPKRSSRRPPQPTKVRTHKRAKRSSWELSTPHNNNNKSLWLCGAHISRHMRMGALFVSLELENVRVLFGTGCCIRADTPRPVC